MSLSTPRPSGVRQSRKSGKGPSVTITILLIIVQDPWVAAGGGGHSPGRLPSHHLTHHRHLSLHEVFYLRILLPTGTATDLLLMLCRKFLFPFSQIKSQKRTAEYRFLLWVLKSERWTPSLGNLQCQKRCAKVETVVQKTNHNCESLHFAQSILFHYAMKSTRNRKNVPTSARQLLSKPVPTSARQLLSSPVPTSARQLLSKPVPSSAQQLLSKPVPASARQLLSKPVPASARQLLSKPVPASARQRLSKPCWHPIDKLYTQRGKVFCLTLTWELNLLLSCFGLSALYSRIFCNRWPSPPAWHP